MATSKWVTGADAWRAFTQQHAELGYRHGRQQFHNFLRHHRQSLIAQDAIRRAKGKFWVAHAERFCELAFDLATGHSPKRQASCESATSEQVEANSLKNDLPAAQDLQQQRVTNDLGGR
jgi:hypothetical protein